LQQGNLTAAPPRDSWNEDPPDCLSLLSPGVASESLLQLLSLVSAAMGLPEDLINKL